MASTLAQKTLADGAKLQLERYSLGEAEAVALRRPADSEEIVLVLNSIGGGGGNTAPRVSWFLDEAAFKRLYDVINNESDYERVVQFLTREIRSAQDANKVDEFLRDF